MKFRLASFAAAAALVALMLPGVAAAANVVVVAGKVIGGHGTLMVASSNQMTVYTFDKDVAGSPSVCLGGCLTAWPALTVAAGDTPTGGAGVTGTLGTSTRTDNGALQVTYNGLPLYFFHNDAKPGDTNGIYPGWKAVVLAAATPIQAVEGKAIGGHGTLMVASSNKMTLYTFDKDVAGSGVSVCTGGCLAAWPALTVTADQAPTGGTGVSGTLGAITRADDGTIQVTYNGLPIYFFKHDAAPGDTNGIYPGWKAIVLTAAAPTQVVEGKVIGSLGTLMIASSNQMTVYTFDKDVAGSGVSACTGGCLTAWPAVTVAADQSPTGGTGVAGTVGAITRADNGSVQVIYNGLPLYFFAKDTKPGDANGIYPGWKAVVLAAAAPPSATPAPTATSAPTATAKLTPPPTSTTGTGSTPGDGSVPAILFAGIAVLGFIVAKRHLAVTRA